MFFFQWACRIILELVKWRGVVLSLNMRFLTLDLWSLVSQFIGKKLTDCQNFANALGQNCIHDFRLRRMHRDLWNVLSAYQEESGFTVDTIVKHMKLNTGISIPGTRHPILKKFQADPSSWIQLSWYHHSNSLWMIFSWSGEDEPRYPPQEEDAYDEGEEVLWRRTSTWWSSSQDHLLHP